MPFTRFAEEKSDNMKKIRYYMAIAGLLAAAAVAVTACRSGSGTAGAGITEAARSEAESAETGAAETKKEASNPEKPAFGTLSPAGSEGGGAGETGEGIGNENGNSAAQPITGAAQEEGETLTGIPVDADRSEAVSIYYGSVCYSYFSEEKEDIKAAADLFTGFSLKEVPDGQLEEATTYQIYFSTDTEQIAAINVDKNGMFYLPEEKKFYKVKAGTFHFEKLDEIYKDSMYADGFDENQCLIQ